ncbi:MAG: CoA transferase, partial [Dehalococcoidia bacterium]|nr:CoA transferase [Dehalococcoidia bacterium]
NVSPQAKKQLGFTYEELCQHNPGIILTEVSGSGVDEPYSSRLGFDISAQAESGITAISGFPDGPGTRCAIGFIDMSTALYAAFGTAMALLHKARTGEGQRVQAALMDTAIAYMGFQGTLAEYELLHQERPRMGNEGYHAFADSFSASDGPIIIAAPNDTTWKRLTKLIGHPELRDNPRFASNEARWTNRAEAYPVIREWASRHSRDEIVELLGKNGVPCGPVNTVAEAYNNPYLQVRDLLVRLPMEGVGMVSHPKVPIRLSKTPGRIEHAAPKAGQDNERVYGELLGLSGWQLEELLSDGVI